MPKYTDMRCSPQTGPEYLDKELGWMPVIPSPVSYRGWRTLWRSGPICTVCNLILKNEEEWEQHYVLNHIKELKSP
jgi:hypothetical protein